MTITLCILGWIACAILTAWAHRWIDKDPAPLDDWDILMYLALMPVAAVGAILKLIWKSFP